MSSHDWMPNKHMTPIIVIFDSSRVDYESAKKLGESLGLARERVVPSRSLANDPVSVIFEPPPKRSWIQKIFGGGN